MPIKARAVSGGKDDHAESELRTLFILRRRRLLQLLKKSF